MVTALLCFNRALCIVNLEFKILVFSLFQGFNRALCIVNIYVATGGHLSNGVLIEHYVLLILNKKVGYGERF